MSNEERAWQTIPNANPKGLPLMRRKAKLFTGTPAETVIEEVAFAAKPEQGPAFPFQSTSNLGQEDIDRLRFKSEGREHLYKSTAERIRDGQVLQQRAEEIAHFGRGVSVLNDNERLLKMLEAAGDDAEMRAAILDAAKGRPGFDVQGVRTALASRSPAVVGMMPEAAPLYTAQDDAEFERLFSDARLDEDEAE